MIYSTTWEHLDKDSKVLQTYTARPCFAAINTSDSFPVNCQYLLYYFGINMAVTQKEATDYFLFLKSIPEFKELMPKSCTQMAKSGKYKVDLHKFNGTKVFTMLTLIRAVVEDPNIVRAVLDFDRKFKYSIINFNILKLCGSVHTTNTNHWITERVKKKRLKEMFISKIWWDDPKPCIKTGLGKHLHDTFNHEDNSYYTEGTVTQHDIDEIKAEKKASLALKETQTVLQVEGL